MFHVNSLMINLTTSQIPVNSHPLLHIIAILVGGFMDCNWAILFEFSLSSIELENFHSSVWIIFSERIDYSSNVNFPMIAILNTILLLHRCRTSFLTFLVVIFNFSTCFKIIYNLSVGKLRNSVDLFERHSRTALWFNYVVKLLLTL